MCIPLNNSPELFQLKKNKAASSHTQMKGSRNTLNAEAKDKFNQTPLNHSRGLRDLIFSSLGVPNNADKDKNNPF
jgi:hypothetical protein